MLKMMDHMAIQGIEQVAMPRIGCGLGGLAWNDVRDIIESVAGSSNLEIIVCSLEMDT